MAAKKEGCGRKAELALERGDFALLERLDAKFHSDVTECISEIDIATVLTTSLRFTDQPNKVWDLAIRLGAKTNGDMSVLLTNRLRICDIVYGRCNWYNPLHLLFNRFQAVKTVTKYLGEHWDLVNYYPKVPAFALYNFVYI